jgi:hypothetical protein
VTAQIAGRKIHVLRDKLQIGAELMKFSEVIARSATVMPLAEEASPRVSEPLLGSRRC